ncbi:MAG: hypothetical protein M0R51_17565, partial [Clostridia bacterium]|nr:hypothetical protein [Clostridia bacterium]
MSTVSEPIVIIYDAEGIAYDISTITSRINYTYGRNQPFAMAEVLVKKAYFNSDDLYWSQFGLTHPAIINGKTTIHVEAYGESYDMYIERHDSEEDTITFLCYNKAYKLKSSINLSSICSINFEIVSTVKYFYMSYDVAKSNPLTILTDSVTDEGIYLIRYYFNEVTLPSYYVDFSVTVSLKDTVYSVVTNYIMGNGTNLFRFVAVNGAGYTIPTCVCDTGYMYDYTQVPTTATIPILDTYTSEEIEAIKNASVLLDENDIIKCRVDIVKCWDAIKAIGYISNRIPFFYDNAYFADYNPSNSASQYSYLYKMHLDNGEAYTQLTEGDPTTIKSLDIYTIIDNEDQGSTYVQTSQMVTAENYATTIAISDVSMNEEGDSIYLPYPESNPTDPATTDNYDRNLQTRKIALNRIVTNYKPMDAIQFTMSEIGSESEVSEYQWTASSVAGLPTDASVQEGDIGKVSAGFMITFYKYLSGVWTRFDYVDDGNQRVSRFAPYTMLGVIEDVQNGLTMYNVPLSCIMLSYPSCVTTLTFGNPQFMDAQGQISGLTSSAQTATEEGTEDTITWDKPVSKIVVGNQTLSKLVDDRAGFTGLIMEKNSDVSLYRLAGYDNGVIQAYFNSNGKFMAGGGAVVLDDNGMRTYNTSSVLQCSIGSNGAITAGSGAVLLNSYGLKTYNTSSVLQCSVGSDGNIIAGGGAIKLNSTGMQVYNGATLTAFIDTAGTYNTGYKGSTPYIKLNGSGLTVKSYYTYSSNSAINFTDSSNNIIGNLYSVSEDGIYLRAYN